MKTTMPMPRLRFTVRRMMFAVAVIGLGFSAIGRLGPIGLLVFPPDLHALVVVMAGATDRVFFGRYQRTLWLGLAPAGFAYIAGASSLRGPIRALSARMILPIRGRPLNGGWR